MSQQFCLKWNNHMNNMMDVFKNLLSTEAMVDVTLACDGLSLKAHKIVLSACSPFFQSLFLENPYKHPIVILKDMKYTELKAIIEFMYHGEVNVAQDQLSALMKTAETLRVKGLAEVTNEKNQSGDESSHRSVSRTGTPPPKWRRGRTRKRSMSDLSDDGASEPKIKQPDSDIEELSGDMDPSTPYSTASTVPLQSHSTNSFHKSQQEQQQQPVEQGADESFASEKKFGVEPSKLLEQTLTTDDLPRQSSRSSVQSNMELQRRPRSSTDHSSSIVPVISTPMSDALVVANQQPESPPDGGSSDWKIGLSSVALKEINRLEAKMAELELDKEEMIFYFKSSNEAKEKSLDEQTVYSEAELQEYMRQRQMQMQGYQQYPYGDQRAYYDVNDAQQHGLPPQINYQVPPGHQPGYPHGQQQHDVPPQPGYPQHQQMPVRQPHYQGAPQMQYQGEHPQQFHGQQPNQAGYQQNLQGMQHQQVPSGYQPEFQANQQQNQQQQHPLPTKLSEQGNQQFVSVPPQQVPEKKLLADQSNSIYQGIRTTSSSENLNTSLAQFLLGDRTLEIQENDIVSRALWFIAQQLTLNDFFEASFGNCESFNRLKEPLKKYIDEKIFPIENTEEENRVIIEQMVSNFDDLMEPFVRTLNVKPNIDYKETMHNFFRQNIKILRIAFSHPLPAQFGKFICTLSHSIFIEFLNVQNSCVEDKNQSLQTAANTIINDLCQDLELHAFHMAVAFMVSRLLSHDPFPLTDINVARNHIVYKGLLSRDRGIHRPTRISVEDNTHFGINDNVGKSNFFDAFFKGPSKTIKTVDKENASQISKGLKEKKSSN